ncbi:WD40-repeat-containing domain protein [Trametes gibbosa]|nr:WD40-repeat-containing domain protein [Trametes gibbosa]
MRYTLARTLPNVHSQGITQVSFSPNGALLATSDLGGKLCIWETMTGTLLHTCSPGSSILSTTWVNATIIFCGLSDGTVMTLHLASDKLYLLGMWSHAYPVEHLLCFGDRLASGAHSKLFIWKINEEEYSTKEREIGKPIEAGGEEVIITGLQWSKGSGRSADTLVVTYMSHGIYLFDANNWSVLRRLGDSAPGFISSLSPDGSHIAVSNLVYGFDIYNINTDAAVLTVPYDFGKGYPVPVVYAHGGRAIIGGSTVGQVNIWYVDGSISRKMQTLAISGQFKLSKTVRDMLLMTSYVGSGRRVLSLAVMIYRRDIALI